MTNEYRIRVLLHLTAGGVIILSAILVDHLLGNPPSWGKHQSIGLALGMVIVLLGFFPRLRPISGMSTNISVSVLSFFVALLFCEGIARIVEFDFSRQEKAWRAVPPYYRMPTVPTGEIYFRRPGPDSWTGQVVNDRLIQKNIVPNPYKNEPVITVRYNKVGFRNPDDMTHWDIAFAGDSFTELGYLPDEALFTAILGRILNIKVLNLGTSYTGPLTHLSYLKDYGLCAGARDAVIVFFEGNDLHEMDAEYARLRQWRDTGEREERVFKKQSSVIKALHEFLQRKFFIRSGGPELNDRKDAYFESKQGDIPVTLHYTPPGRSELSDETLRNLDSFLREYASFGEKRQVKAWLAYMPSKRRVLDGKLRFVGKTSKRFRNWRPTDLPVFISEQCRRHGIGFIDLTPALVEETRKKGELAYNSIFDSHINSQGSLVVARVLAEHLSVRYGNSGQSKDESPVEAAISDGF